MTNRPKTMMNPHSDAFLDGVTIGDRNGEMHVFLDLHGDGHIVTKFIVNKKSGQVHEVILPREEWAWERAVARAKRAMAFFMTAPS